MSVTVKSFAAPDAVSVRRALLSVHDKTGLIDFASALVARGVELLSTGGTASSLRESGTGYDGEMEFSAEQAKGRDDNDDAQVVNEKIVTEKRSKNK